MNQETSSTAVETTITIPDSNNIIVGDIIVLDRVVQATGWRLLWRKITLQDWLTPTKTRAIVTAIDGNKLTIQYLNGGKEA